MIATGTSISLELQCLPDCHTYAEGMLGQLSGGKYDRGSLLEIPESMDDWRAEHRTARKRVWKAERAAFTADVLFREFHADDIHEINTSALHRQGRPMNPAYLERQEFSPLPVYPCGRHAIRTSGVFDGPRCVAYLLMRRCGDLALISMILGHDDFLDKGIMYQLFEFALEREIEHGPGVVFYNRHDSGTEGLRFFKERCGFSEQPIEWLA